MTELREAFDSARETAASVLEELNKLVNLSIYIAPLAPVIVPIVAPLKVAVGLASSAMGASDKYSELQDQFEWVNEAIVHAVAAAGKEGMQLSDSPDYKCMQVIARRHDQESGILYPR